MTRQNHSAQQSLNQRQWQAHVQAFRRSGLSRAEYCRQHKLSYHALVYWQRKFSGLSRGAPVPTLVPVVIGGSIGQASPHAVPAALRVILPGRLSVEVGDAFSPATLIRLLATLEGR